MVEPVPVGQAARDYLAHAVNPTLLKGLTELCKQEAQDPVVRYHFAKYPCRVEVCSSVHGHIRCLYSSLPELLGFFCRYGWPIGY